MKAKIISSAVLIVLGIFVCVSMFAKNSSIEQEYQSYLDLARKNAEKNIPYNSINYYQKAFAIRNNDESIYREYIEQTKKFPDNGRKYYEALKKYLNVFPDSVKAYEDVCSYYYNDSQDYHNALKTAKQAKEKGMSSDALKFYYNTCGYMYKVMRSELDEAYSFLGGYALVKRDDRYGYLNASGEYIIAPSKYSKASMMMSGAAAVFDEDEKSWVVINDSGYVVARPSDSLDTLSFLSNGFMPASKEGKYTYLTQSLNVDKTKFQYDYCSNFKNNVGAVKKDGKWALVNSKGESITDYIFEDVKLDEFNACVNNGIVMAKTQGKYYFYNTSGVKVSEQGFDDVCQFAEGDKAAVCIDKKWGFADSTGNIVIEPQFDDARSFSMNLAAVNEKGVWKYIDKYLTPRVEGEFSDCKPFSGVGIAAVCMKNGKWSYIKLFFYS